METAIKKAIEGGYEPWAWAFLDVDTGVQLHPKPYRMEYGEDGHEDFECPHAMFVVFFDEEDEGVNDENSTLGFAAKSFLLDPLFWQALGKAEGWEQPNDKYHWCQVNDEGVKNGVKFFQGELIGETKTKISYKVITRGRKTPVIIHKKYIELSPRNEWRRVWHRFIDHIASGGDAESFFNNLLK